MRVLRLWVLPNNGLETVPTLRGQLRAFLRQKPDTKVEVTVRTTATLWRHLFQLLKRPQDAGRPDLVQIPAHWTAALAHLGLLEDLSELDAELSLSGWLEACREHCQLGGEGLIQRPQVFSLPWWMETTVLYYRRDVLERAGLAPEEALGSWEALEETCRRLSRGRRGGPAMHAVANPNARGSVSLADVAPSVWSRGGDFLSRDGSRCVIHREEAFGGIRGYLRMLSEGWMPLLGPGGLVPRGLFDGGCALQFSGRLPASLRTPRRRGSDPGAAVGALMCPAGPRGRAPFSSAHHLAVVRGCGAPGEVYALARYLTGAGPARGYAASVGGLPCTAAGWDEVFEERPEFGAAFRGSLRQARALPNLVVLGTLERVFDRGMETLLRAIVGGTYAEGLLRQELIYAAAEMDYILSLYGTSRQ